MRHKRFASGMLVLLCASLCPVTVTGESDKADFSGKWILDETQSEGTPAGIKQVMSVTQGGGQLFIDTKVYPNNGVAYAVKETLVLSGKEVSFTSELNGQTTVGKRTSKWLADGQAIEVTERLTHVTKTGRVAVQTKRRLVMSADGQTFTIEVESKTSKGNISARRVFIRQMLN